MGKVVKSLTGHGGGGTTKTKENSTKTESQQSWLEQNKQYQTLQNNALNEANNFNMPQYQLAGANNNIDQALAGLGQGVDTQGYKDAYLQMLSQGQGQYNQGSNALSSALGKLNQIGNMSQADYQNMMKSEYNSDLVNQEIEQLKGDVNDQYQDQVQHLNQQANMAGGMGNSRAGVAQGVMAGQAQKAIASGSVQYRVAEEQQAYNRLNSYMNQQSSAANNIAQIGSNMSSQGLQMYGAGMGYYSQYNQAQTQNLQNQFQAGQYQRQMQQQQYDVNRQNELIRQSPALQRLSYYNQSFLPMANLSTSGSGTFTGTGENKTPGQGGNLLGGLMGMGGAMLGQHYGMSDTGTGMMSMFGGMAGNAFGSSY
ncbi:hypothetical protein OH773_06720 [Buttiauxella sp. WJP83]|uniref:hypothetical protein n=1 Tax=Buttiauxella sp. WJP83 TaxID=2986951 RepID=UPI0022DE3465|nr:hypothetical protein [Buttiauxella sp. WJP83]WBM71928.1 hypothetical protein OH773_06720 [Buttiauxella sp. WJP83]